MRWPATSRSSGGWPAPGSASPPSSRPTATGMAWRSPPGPSWPAARPCSAWPRWTRPSPCARPASRRRSSSSTPSRREAAAAAAGAQVELVAAEADSLAATLAAWRARPGAAMGAATLRLHLEIETGLARAGFRPERGRGRRARHRRHARCRAGRPLEPPRELPRCRRVGPPAGALRDGRSGHPVGRPGRAAQTHRGHRRAAGGDGAELRDGPTRPRALRGAARRLSGRRRPGPAGGRAAAGDDAQGARHPPGVAGGRRDGRLRRPMDGARSLPAGDPAPRLRRRLGASVRRRVVGPGPRPTGAARRQRGHGRA